MSREREREGGGGVTWGKRHRVRERERERGMTWGKRQRERGG